MQGDLNTITLGPELLQAFYGEHLTLVTAKGIAPEQDQADAPSLPGSEGSNKKNITILFVPPASKENGTTQLDFIKKILQACKLTMEDVALLPVTNAETNIELLKASYRPKILLMFGLDPTSIGLPIRFPEFKLQSYDGTTYLSAPDIAPLLEDTEHGKLLKSRLWACLRSLFNI